MANTDGKIALGLDIPKTASQINADIKKLQSQLKTVQVTGALDTSSTVKQINSQIAALESQLNTINIKANDNTSDAQKTGQKIGQTIADSVQKAIDGKGINIEDLSTIASQAEALISKVTAWSTALAKVKNIGKCRMSVRISNNLLYCFEYALLA